MRTAWQRLSALCLAAFLVVSCSTAVDDTPAPDITSRPPVDYQALETAIETKIMSGWVGWQTIGAVLVSVDGTTRIAHYRNGRKPDEALHVWSVTKSVTSALIGIALDERIIGSLDQTLDELLPRYRRFLTQEQKQVSLRQLMDMTAGYPPTSRSTSSGRSFSIAMTRCPSSSPKAYPYRPVSSSSTPVAAPT